MSDDLIKKVFIKNRYGELNRNIIISISKSGTFNKKRMVKLELFNADGTNITEYGSNTNWPDIEFKINDYNESLGPVDDQIIFDYISICRKNERYGVDSKVSPNIASTWYPSKEDGSANDIFYSKYEKLKPRTASDISYHKRLNTYFPPYYEILQNPYVLSTASVSTQSTTISNDPFIALAQTIQSNPELFEYPNKRRDFGTDPYYLTNGAKIDISWKYNGEEVGAKEYSNNWGDEMDTRDLGLEFGTKRNQAPLTDITKTIKIWIPESEIDNPENTVDGFKNKYFTYGEVKEIPDDTPKLSDPIPADLPLKVGSKGDSVKKIQAKVGISNPDGDFGAGVTEPAVKKWQKNNDLPETGIIDKENWEKMFTVPDVDPNALPPDLPLKVGSKGDSVKKVQEKVGISNPDGDFGSKVTEPAVKTWQKSNGLAETGIVDKENWEKMFPVTPTEESVTSPTYGFIFDGVGTTHKQWTGVDDKSILKEIIRKWEQKYKNSKLKVELNKYGYYTTKQPEKPSLEWLLPVEDPKQISKTGSSASEESSVVKNLINGVYVLDVTLKDIMYNPEIGEMKITEKLEYDPFIFGEESDQIDSEYVEDQFQAVEEEVSEYDISEEEIQNEKETLTGEVFDTPGDKSGSNGPTIEIKSNGMTKKEWEKNGTFVDGSKIPSNIADPPKYNMKVSINDTMKNEYLPVIKGMTGYTSGIKLLAIVMAQKEGFKKGTRSYNTNNPGNIGNTDSGSNKSLKSLKDGIQLQIDYIYAVAKGKKSAYPLGSQKVIKPYWSKEIANNNGKGEAYEGSDPYLPGYKFVYSGKIEQFCKIYSTGSRHSNSYVSMIVSWFRQNGFTNVTEETTIDQLIQLNKKINLLS